MECEIAVVNSNKQQIKDIFDTVKTIAVVGCSPKPEKDSHRVSAYLQQEGFEILPIYPKEDRILGQKVYRSLEDIDTSVDMVVVFRKPSVVGDVVASIAKRDDVKILWTQIGIVNNDAAQKAKEMGLEVVQNKCAMVEHRNL